MFSSNALNAHSRTFKTEDEESLVQEPFNDLVHSAAHSSVHEAVHAGAKRVPGLEYYLGPKLAVFSTVSDFSHRIKATDPVKHTTNAKISCAAVGTTTRELIHLFGSRALIASAPETLGASLFGLFVLDIGAKKGGDLAQAVCLKMHESNPTLPESNQVLLYNLAQASQNTQIASSSPNLPLNLLTSSRSPFYMSPTLPNVSSSGLKMFQPKSSHGSSINYSLPLSKSDTTKINPLPIRLEKHFQNMGLPIKPALKTLLQNNKGAQRNLHLVCSHLKKNQEELLSSPVLQNVNFNNLQAACGFVGELAKLSGDRNLMMISTFAQTGVQIATAISSGAIPIVGVPMAIMNCVNLLMGDNDAKYQTESSKQFFIELLERFCAQLHAHIDYIHDDLSKKIILGFVESKKNQANIIDFLRNVYEEIKYTRFESRERLETLSDALQALSVGHRNETRIKRLAEIHKYINLTTGPHQLSSDTFISLFNEYKTDICNIHKKDPSLTGKIATRATLLKDFEQDDTNHFGCDFNISSFYHAISSVLTDSKKTLTLINPTVYSWQLLGFLELIKKRYSTDEKAENKISTAEVLILEEALQLGKSTQDFSILLRSKALLHTLLNQYVASGKQFLTHLKSYTELHEKEVNKTLYKNFIETINGLDKRVINQFETQEIKFDLEVKKGYWFAGHHSNNHPNFGQAIEGHFTLTGGSGYRYIVEPSVKAYENERKKSVDEFRTAYTKTLQNLLAQHQLNEKTIIETKFNFDAPLTMVVPHYYYGYAFPKLVANQVNPYTVVLPLPAHYKFPIPHMLQTAEWLKVGNVEFEYSVAPAPSKYQFTLECYFKINNERYLISTLNSEFDPTVYQGNEALWWWWVGGNYAKNGGCDWTVVRRHQTPQTNIWITQAYIPACANHAGRRDEIKSQDQKLLNAEQKINLNEESDLLKNNIFPKIKAQIRKHTSNFYSILSREIHSNEQSDLTKSLIEFSFNYYLLRFALFLGFGEKNCNLVSDLLFFSANNNAPTMRNRLDIINFLNKDKINDFSLIIEVEKCIQFIQNKMPNAIDALCQISTSHLMDSLLTETLTYFSKLIDWYKPRAVDENQLVIKISREKQQEEENKLLSSILQATGEALLGLPKEHQQTVIDKIRATLSTKGISRPNVEKHFLPAPTTPKSSCLNHPSLALQTQSLFKNASSSTKLFYSKERPKLQGTFKNKKIIFEECETLGDGRCGFYSIGISPEEVVQSLLKQTNNGAVRCELSEEIEQTIKQDILTGNAAHWQLPELKDAALPQHIVQRYLSPYNKEDKLAAEKDAQTQLELKTFSSHPAIYRKYVRDLELPGAWLGCKSAKLFAQYSAKPFNLCIWEKDTTQSGTIKIRMADSYLDDKLTDLHHIYFIGNHFNLLAEVGVKLESELESKTDLPKYKMS